MVLTQDEISCVEARLQSTRKSRRNEQRRHIVMRVFSPGAPRLPAPSPREAKHQRAVADRASRENTCSQIPMRRRWRSLHLRLSNHNFHKISSGRSRPLAHACVQELRESIRRNPHKQSNLRLRSPTSESRSPQRISKSFNALPLLLHVEGRKLDFHLLISKFLRSQLLVGNPLEHVFQRRRKCLDRVPADCRASALWLRSARSGSRWRSAAPGR